MYTRTPADLGFVVCPRGPRDESVFEADDSGRSAGDGVVPHEEFEQRHAAR